MPTPLVFDCDGTLVASEPLYAAVDARVLGAYGLPLTAEAIRLTYMGVPIAVMLENMATRFDLTFPENILDVLDTEVQKLLDTDLLPMPGIQDCLHVLQHRGHPMAVATNSQRRRAERNLLTTQLTGYFGTNIAAIDMVEKGKPAPDVYLLAARLLGVDPHLCIAIEDSAVGMHAAIAAGMIGIGFAPADHGPHATPDLQEAGAHIIITNMRDLPAAIETAEELQALI